MVKSLDLSYTLLLDAKPTPSFYPMIEGLVVCVQTNKVLLFGFVFSSLGCQFQRAYYCVLLCNRPTYYFLYVL